MTMPGTPHWSCIHIHTHMMFSCAHTSSPTGQDATQFKRSVFAHGTATILVPVSQVAQPSKVLYSERPAADVVQNITASQIQAQKICPSIQDAVER
jgi:hypothetical protein